MTPGPEVTACVGRRAPAVTRGLEHGSSAQPQFGRTAVLGPGTVFPGRGRGREGAGPAGVEGGACGLGMEPRPMAGFLRVDQDADPAGPWWVGRPNPTLRASVGLLLWFLCF